MAISSSELKPWMQGRVLPFDVPDPTFVQNNAARAPTGPPPASSPAKHSTPLLRRSVEVLADESWPQVPGYVIVGELGRGGMGVVYKARQAGLQRLVALKMIRDSGFADAGGRARFRAEAEAVARMQHPHIVQIFEIGTAHTGTGSCPYFSLEYVDGGSLASALKFGLPLVPTTAKLVETIARAVHYAHQQGIVHRDLKPANILLQSSNGSVQPNRAFSAAVVSAPPQAASIDLLSAIPKIADFGLAKQLGSGDRSLTTQGTVVGTPEYMAPEQVERAAPVEASADIYALGVILYELLTGRCPFEGGNPWDILDQVRRHEPVAPSRLQPRIPRDLDTICLKALRKEPGKRYATAAELADDLNRFRHGEPIRAKPVGVLERAGKWARRRPAVAALALLVFLTTVLGLTGVSVALLYALAGWDAADQRRHEAQAERIKADNRWNESEKSLYFNRIARSRMERGLNNLRLSADLLQQCVPDPAEPVPDRRGWEWHHLMGLHRAELLAISTGRFPVVNRLTHSRDGRYLGVLTCNPYVETKGGAPGALQIHDLLTGERITRWACYGFGTDLAFSADGRRLAASTEAGLTVVEVQTGESFPESPSMRAAHAAVALSPSGDRLTAFSHRGTLTVHDVAHGTELRRLELKERIERTAAFNRDASRLALATQRGILILDVITGQFIGAPLGPGGCRSLAFSPDGSLLASARADVGEIWEVATGRLLHTLRGTSSGVLGIAFSPDARFVATAGADGTVRQWLVRTGSEDMLLRGHDGRVVSVDYDPTGRALVSGGLVPGDIKVWDVTRQQDFLTVCRLRGVEALGFSADSRAVTVVARGGNIEVCDAETGRLHHSLKVDLLERWLTPAATAAFSPDGKRLAGIVNGDEKCLHIWNVARGGVERTLSQRAPIVHTIFSPNGRRVACSGVFRGTKTLERVVTVWDADTGRELRSIRSPTGLASASPFGVVAFGPGGELLACDDYQAVRDANGTLQARIRIKVLRVATGEVVAELAGQDRVIASLTFSPDGRLLASGSHSGRIVIWDLATGESLRLPQMQAALILQSLAFSPDGRRLAGVDREQVHVWDVESGQEVLLLRGVHRNPNDGGFNPKVAWSPDGLKLAASHWNGDVCVWEADAGGTEASRLRRRWAAAMRSLNWHLAGLRAAGPDPLKQECHLQGLWALGNIW